NTGTKPRSLTALTAPGRNVARHLAYPNRTPWPRERLIVGAPSPLRRLLSASSRDPLKKGRCSHASGGGAAEVGRLGEREELLQALVFDLPDPLSGHVERSADFVQRLRTL